jgi:ABC-type uncharacterized transport system ATPase subunit
VSKVECTALYKFNADYDVDIESNDSHLSDILEVSQILKKTLRSYKERLQLALYETLIDSSDLIIISDAFVDLDVVVRMRLLRYFKNLPKTVLYFTNHVADVCVDVEWCDRVTIVNKFYASCNTASKLKKQYGTLFNGIIFELSKCKLYNC